jgi:hypothetical protein
MINVMLWNVDVIFAGIHPVECTVNYTINDLSTLSPHVQVVVSERYSKNFNYPNYADDVVCVRNVHRRGLPISIDSKTQSFINKVPWRQDVPGGYDQPWFRF